MSNQQDLLDYLRGLPNEWFTCKELHEQYTKEERDIGIRCITRMVSKLHNWGILDRKKDNFQKHGYEYKLKDG